MAKFEGKVFRVFVFAFQGKGDGELVNHIYLMLPSQLSSHRGTLDNFLTNARSGCNGPTLVLEDDPPINYISVLATFASLPSPYPCNIEVHHHIKDMFSNRGPFLHSLSVNVLNSFVSKVP
ncbi:hypothetical protein E6C27_scaffold20G00350 [Cucumis melo var. makuwa]|uniref:Uncharacterized protein n=1 Tax=Cucumis melo var. makuwa TaxID=1194695 RepID=A0A5A7T5L1_CUCMM|nr:hypothetical protein E6C27_scaffold20G00350 [Cucumis melo var. makuwa]